MDKNYRHFIFLFFVFCSTYHAAVDIEPPVADEELLVVQSPVGAEQAGDGGHGGLGGAAHVVHLAVSLLGGHSSVSY